MSKKLKSGERVKIRGCDFVVTQAAGAYQKRCMICQMHNKCIPCFDDDPQQLNNWTQQDCIKLLPVNCYLKPMLEA